MTAENALPVKQDTSAGRLAEQPEIPLRPVRVLHVVNGEHYSGAARVQDLLAGALPALGVHVCFACVKPKLFPQMRVHRDAPLFETPMTNGFDIRPAWKIARLIRQEQIDIVHTHTPRSILVGAVASLLTGRPMIYHVHSPTSRDSARQLQNWVNDKVERLGCRRAARMIAVSESLKGHMQSLGFSSERIDVAPNGTPRLEPFERRAPDKAWTIGAVALFRPRKGLEVLLDALATCRSRGLNVTLRAVGPFETPEYERGIKQHVESLDLEDAVTWVGLSRDVPAELKQMDLFALPSLYGEGLPMVVLEAMSAATPIVATQVEGVPELVRDGQDGLLVEPGDHVSLADGIERFVCGEIDWRGCSDSARRRHNESFSDQSMAARVAAVYRSLLED